MGAGVMDWPMGCLSNFWTGAGLAAGTEPPRCSCLFGAGVACGEALPCLFSPDRVETALETGFPAGLILVSVTAAGRYTETVLSLESILAGTLASVDLSRNRNVSTGLPPRSDTWRGSIPRLTMRSSFRPEPLTIV